MKWIDPDGRAHKVSVISTLGNYTYIQLTDGSTINVRRSALTDDPAPGPPRPPPPRYLDTPPPAVSPKRRKDPDDE